MKWAFLLSKGLLWLYSPGHNHFWIIDDVTNMDVVVGPRGNSVITLFEPYRLCSLPISHETLQITEDKQLHTTSKELMVVAMTRRKNSDEKSGGGPCCEGLDRGITSL